MAPAADPRSDLPDPPERGLSSEEAEERLHRVGPNLLVPERRRGRLLTLAWRSVTEPMALLLLAAAATYLVLGDTPDAVVALLALAPVAAVSVVLETRAERALDELGAMTAPTARVHRDGRWITVAAGGVVPGDILALREGDVVPADGRLVDGRRLVVDESALTGESIPVTKSVDAELGEESTWAGTTVLSGRGATVVTATGRRARFGRIGSLVAEAESGPTPLERTVRRLVLRLGVVALGTSLAVVGVELVRGQGWGAAVIAAVSLGIAAVPEEFPLVFTIYLALGARRLARGKALVRRLTGVETLGSTTVICTDKTGTLTLGRLEVAEVVPLGGADALTVLRYAVLASEPSPFDPLDQAVLRRAALEGVDVADLHGGAHVEAFDLDAGHRYVTHLWRRDAGVVVAAKGALEGILSCSRSSGAETAAAEAAMRHLGRAGMRVVAVAGGAPEEAGQDRGAAEDALHLLGLVAFSDPPRPEVPEALERCRSAGIRIIMITGDHPETARAVATRLGLPVGEHSVVTGDDLDAVSDADLPGLAAAAGVFARIRPEQKHRLVRVLKQGGDVVAMTGDGVNDAPALKEADIGVAMGERGTTVAREAATLVLLDDNFATIVGAVADGRRIFANLRHAFGYLVAFHIPLLLAALVVPLVGRPLLLLPIHLIVLEFLLHPVVALVFEQDPAPPGSMERPPRPPDQGLLDRTLVLPAARGVSLAAVTLAAFFFGDASTPMEARAFPLAVLFVGELLLVLVERSGTAPLWRVRLGENRALLPVLGAAFAMVAVLFEVPALREAMNMANLGAAGWLGAAALAFAAVLWTEPLKARRR